MVVSRVADGGSGYQVDAQHLQALAGLADQIGQDAHALAAKASAALEVGGQGGLQIGAALASAESGWSGQLVRLAGEAIDIGSRLNINAAAYTQTESSVLESMMLRLGGPESAL